MIKFVNHSTLGRGDHILVKQLIRKRLVTKGRIEKSPLGYYQYFEPQTNELNPSFKDDDLDTLKKKVKQHLEKKY